MNKYQSLTIYSILIILTGVILISLAYYPIRELQYTVASTIIASAVFAFLTAYKSKDLEIPLHYHALHGVGMLIYGLVILFFATDVKKFFDVTIYFLLYYGMSEIIFCFQLFMLKQKYISWRLIVARLIIAFVISMGAIVILLVSNSNQNVALMAAGGIFVFSGIFLIIFKTVLKKVNDLENIRNIK